jgi:short-subunit dehydrogenase
MKEALLLGATSDLARALARRLAADGWGLTLAARNASELERIVADLALRPGAGPVRGIAFDALDFARAADFAATLPAAPDAVFCVFGTLGDPVRAETDPEERRRILDTNFTAAVHVLEPLAAGLAARGGGQIIGISSVAGERGRAGNAFYTSAKAGFTAYLSGLRGRMRSRGVHVLTVKPGFLRTKMTANLRLPPLLTASPERAAAVILRAAGRGRDVVYVPGIWRLVMAVIRAIPEPVFKRLSLEGAPRHSS